MSKENTKSMATFVVGVLRIELSSYRPHRQILPVNYTPFTGILTQITCLIWFIMQKMSNEVELVDLVDANGVIQKQKVPRNEVDIHTDLHLQIVVAIIFNKAGEIVVEKRALTKSSEPGKIDNICGGVRHAETPKKTVMREAKEEAGISPNQIMLVRQGLNKYNRYRYLFIGTYEGKLGQVNPNEVEWVRFMSPKELREKEASREFEFVGDFFEDMDIAIQALRK
jgi:isopentenyldiphosphate isomerase